MTTDTQLLEYRNFLVKEELRLYKIFSQAWRNYFDVRNRRADVEIRLHLLEGFDYSLIGEDNR